MTQESNRVYGGNTPGAGTSACNRFLEWSVAAQSLSPALMAFDVCRQRFWVQPGEFYLTQTLDSGKRMRLDRSNGNALEEARIAWDEALDDTPLAYLKLLIRRARFRRLLVDTASSIQVQRESIQALLASPRLEVRPIDYAPTPGRRALGIFARTAIPPRTVIEVTGVLVPLSPLLFEVLSALDRTQFVLESNGPIRFCSRQEATSSATDRPPVCGNSIRVVAQRHERESVDRTTHYYVTAGAMQLLNHRCTEHMNVNPCVYETIAHAHSEEANSSGGRRNKAVCFVEPRYDWQRCETAWHKRRRLRDLDGVRAGEELATCYGAPEECGLPCPGCERNEPRMEAER